MVTRAGVGRAVLRTGGQALQVGVVAPVVLQRTDSNTTQQRTGGHLETEVSPVSAVAAVRQQERRGAVQRPAQQL